MGRTLWRRLSESSLHDGLCSLRPQPFGPPPLHPPTLTPSPSPPRSPQSTPRPTPLGPPLAPLPRLAALPAQESGACRPQGVEWLRFRALAVDYPVRARSAAVTFKLPRTAPGPGAAAGSVPVRVIAVRRNGMKLNRVRGSVRAAGHGPGARERMQPSGRKAVRPSELEAEAHICPTGICCRTLASESWGLVARQVHSSDSAASESYSAESVPAGFRVSGKPALIIFRCGV